VGGRNRFLQSRRRYLDPLVERKIAIIETAGKQRKQTRLDRRPGQRLHINEQEEFKLHNVRVESGDLQLSCPIAETSRKDGRRSNGKTLGRARRRGAN